MESENIKNKFQETWKEKGGGRSVLAVEELEG